MLRTGRPVLAVLNDEPELVFREAESEVWRARLMQAKEQIAAAVRAVGRVEVLNHPSFEWIGTGWLVREDVIVTNRHVAEEFGMRQGAQFRFRQGTLGRPMKPSIDFLEEFGLSAEREFDITEVLHIEDDMGPDIALLRVSRNGSRPLAPPIALSPHAVIEKQQVAVIGYPASDSRIPDQQLMIDIFGNVFDKKRLAPGQVIRLANDAVEHDCSTLGGNSGSVVLDLESGAAVGLHFAGRFLQANFAVPADAVSRRLQDIGHGEGRVTRAAGRGDQARGQRQSTDAPSTGRHVTVTIPVRITVDIGDAIGQVSADQSTPARVAAAHPRPPAMTVKTTS